MNINYVAEKAGLVFLHVKRMGEWSPSGFRGLPLKNAGFLPEASGALKLAPDRGTR